MSREVHSAVISRERYGVSKHLLLDSSFNSASGKHSRNHPSFTLLSPGEENHRLPLNSTNKWPGKLLTHPVDILVDYTMVDNILHLCNISMAKTEIHIIL